MVGGFDWNCDNALAPSFSPPFSNNVSSTFDGWLIGVGLEYATTNNWTAKFECHYIGFGADRRRDG